ncbi:MAG: branched-chain amino acid ABC transporter permease [Actinobacteria bacterium]|nr:branched-chain amino acid ABC transporter permease [Actinomycetota bacterium]
MLLALVLIAFAAPARPAGAQLAPPGKGIVQGRLEITRDGRTVPVAGVRIEVRRRGTVVGSTRTGRDGRWRIVVPRGRGYEVRIVTATLPGGVELRDEGRTVLRGITLATPLPRSLAFPLGKRQAGDPLSKRLLETFAAGLRVGLVIGMAAIGLSLIFGVTGLVNFAHGELVTFGALIAYLASSSGLAHLPLAIAAVVATAAGGLFGGTLELALFRPLRRRGTGNIALIVVTIGMSLLVRHVFLLVFDRNPRPYRQFAVQRAVFAGLAPKELVIMAVAAVVMVLVGVLLQRSRLGTAVRAVADNRDLAESSGIDVARIILTVWLAGGALAALGGVLYGTAEKVQWDMGFNLLLLMFAAVVLGGLGTAYGAMVGGLVVGVVSEVSTVWVPVDFKVAVALGALILVLLFRPQGVLGVRERLG